MSRDYPITEDERRFIALWREFGGSQHGPSVEHVQMPYEQFFRFCDALERSFQPRVALWMDACFGPEISADGVERNYRFLEEALELVQARGLTRDEAVQLVDYVYGRPEGEANQEVGGVMVTLAALCLAGGLDMHTAGNVELARVWTKVEQIRTKQAAKPKYGPLPQ